jgi:hypothetical protein
LRRILFAIATQSLRNRYGIMAECYATTLASLCSSFDIAAQSLHDRFCIAAESPQSKRDDIAA